MAKKSLLVLFMFVLAAAGAFAQNDFASMAKNTFTVDVGPTIVGFAIGKAADLIGEEGISAKGFGIAGQYERQLSRPLSVGARFAYLSTNMKMNLSESTEDGSADLKYDLNLVSFSVEGHVRLYPFGETFFLDGMAGYANLTTGVDGKLKVVESGGHTEIDDDVNFDGSRGYVKLGAKLGWRISFGRNGGFTFEPAIGYSYGIGLGKTIGKQLADKIGGDAPDFDEAFSLIENYVFIGGPRVTLAFGYRF
jgi:hypothetical protein